MPKRRKEFEKLIKDKGIKPTELAETLGYQSKYTVYKWIYGVSEPNAATMLRLMELLEISAEEVLHLFAD